MDISPFYSPGPQQAATHSPLFNTLPLFNNQNPKNTKNPKTPTNKIYLSDIGGENNLPVFLDNRSHSTLIVCFVYVFFGLYNP